MVVCKPRPRKVHTVPSESAVSTLACLLRSFKNDSAHFEADRY